MNHPKTRAERRRKSEIHKDLRTPKYRQRVVAPEDKFDHRPTKRQLLEKLYAEEEEDLG